MPLYEYRCKKCDRVFEVRQKFSDDPLLLDPECGGEVEKLISAPQFHFKGTGWYVTDYARSGAKGKNEQGKSESGKSDSGDSSKGDSGKGDSGKGDSSKSESGKKESSSDSKSSESKTATTTTTTTSDSGSSSSKKD